MHFQIARQPNRIEIRPHNWDQESRREGWTDAAIMLCKLNKSLYQSSIKVGIHRQKVCIP